MHTELAPLGVGILYNPALPPFVENHLDAVDFVSVIPDMFWHDHGPGAADRFRELPSWTAVMDDIAARTTVVAHDIGLSLGSAAPWDEGYLEQLARWQERYRFSWHSDHLSYVRINTPAGAAHNAGVALPVPYDKEVLDLVAGRTREATAVLGVPFLVENGVAYVPVPEADMDEPTFLRALCSRGECGLLLDLHNLYVDARNGGVDPSRALAALDLASVVEVHIAGGSELAGMYTDSHAGPCPDVVFDLLEQVVARAPTLAAITFEFHDSYYPRLKIPGILEQLSRARDLWDARPARRDAPVRQAEAEATCPTTPSPSVETTLGEYQRAMSDLVASPAACRAMVEDPERVLADYRLDDRARRRVEAITSSPGMQVNCTLYRMNRVTPIYSLLPRTCSALGDGLGAHLDDFWAETPETDLQFVAESERFAAWLAARLGGCPRESFVADVLRYELALNRMRFGGEKAPARLHVDVRHDPAAVAADPRELVAAAVPSAAEARLLLERVGDDVLTMVAAT